MSERSPESEMETAADEEAKRPPRWRKLLIGLGVAFAVACVVLFGAYRAVVEGLPKLDTATDYRPFLPTRLIDVKGRVVAEYGEQRRIVVPYEILPKYVVEAFLASEDSTFFTHGGVDIVAILRAAVKNFTSGKVRQGASTITQQVAKTFFLTPERTIIRKLREVALAQRLEEALSKEEILFLYLNQIYFGQGAYGVESAANIYFGKSITEVSVAEAAVLAGLPKAPSAYSPYYNPERARSRQIYVVRQMQDNGFLTEEEAAKVLAEEVPIRRWQNPAVDGGYYTEQVRRYLVEKYGEERVLRDGLQVQVSMDRAAQLAAQRAVKAGVIDLEKRHGYRGAITRIAESDRESVIARLERELHRPAAGEVLRFLGPNTIVDSAVKEEEAEGFEAIDEAESAAAEKGDEVPDLTPDVHVAKRPSETVEALITEVKKDRAVLAVGRHVAAMPLFDTAWAIRFDLQQKVWTGLSNMRSRFKAGDLVQVRIVDPEALKKTSEGRARLGQWKNLRVDPDVWWAELEPQPQVQAALLATDPDTAEIRAIVGGYDFFESQFNRAFQARRQPGSSFKPVVYAAALSLGYNAATMVVDSPDVYVNMASDSTQVTYWKPKNYDDTFYGPMTVREALVRSRNVPTLRIAQDVGLEAILEMAARLGVSSPIARDYSIALGSNGVSLLDMVQVYTTFDAGGVRRDLKMLRRVLDRDGNVLEQSVPDWVVEGRQPTPEERAAGDAEYYNAEQVLDPLTNYVMVYLLHQVVQHGTGWRARELGRPAAGKTGTTNDNVDSWFVGFTPELVAGVWVGIDQPEMNLGPYETGSVAANPIWNDFMKAALAGTKPKDWTPPEEIVWHNVDTKTGYIAGLGAERIVKMPFLYGNEPTHPAQVERGPTEDEFLRLDMGF